MSYHHNQHHGSEPNHFLHGWKNYSVKASYNPIPTFKFPVRPSTITPQTTTITPETTTAEQITKFIQDIITSTSDATMTELTESSTSTSTTTTENSILNNTLTDIVGLNPNITLNEATTSNNSVIFDIMEGTTSSSMTEIMQNQNGTDLLGNMDNNGTILTTISEIASSTAENTVSIISTTTEKAITFVTEAVNQISTSTEILDNKHENDQHYHYHMGTHRLLYVILFVIIAILMLIGVILLLIYIRYRKNSFKALNNYYEVSPMKEKTPSDIEQEAQKECPTEIYMHYHC